MVVKLLSRLAHLILLLAMSLMFSAQATMNHILILENLRSHCMKGTSAGGAA